MEPGRAHRLDAHLCLEDAGVVDEAVQPSEHPVRGLEQPDHVGLDRDVAGHGHGLPTGRLNIGNDTVGGFLVLPVVDADRVAGAGSQPCRGCADAAAGPGDDENLAHQAAGASTPAQRFIVPNSSRPLALR